MSTLTGSMLSHYRIGERIGAGGMGVVYRARDERSRRDVALKVLAPAVSGAAREQLRAEAEVLARLSHDNIAAIFDFGRERGTDYLVMEFVPGLTLEQLITGAPVAGDHLRSLALQLARGLAAAHETGVVHRDIKPGNILVTPQGRLKIIDFGIASEVPPVDADTKTDANPGQPLAGTLAYMAPERLRGAPATPASDVYSAAVVIYQLACGRPPFEERHPIRLMDLILHARPTPLRAVVAGIDPSLDTVIMRGLEKGAFARYSDGRLLASALETPGGAVAGPLGTPSDQLARPCPTERSAWTEPRHAALPPWGTGTRHPVRLDAPPEMAFP